MRIVLIIAEREIRDALRNRWVAASVLLLAGLALALASVGAAPGGSVKASALAVTVVSLASLSVYLVPLIALMLAFDALVGEFERGTMLLLLSYPVQRWQVVLGKFCGHLSVLGVAIALGYGSAGIWVGFAGTGWTDDWTAFVWLLASSVLLGAVFLSLGYVASIAVRERATAAGIAIAVWMVFVVLYDLSLLGVLLSTEELGFVDQRVFSVLLLANPADAYRLFNLAGSEGAGLISGLSNIDGGVTTSKALLLGVMTAWIVVPLLGITLLFKRREL